MAASNIENIKKPVAALYPVVEELRCVELMIPDDDGYLWILAGFVSILGQSWSWSGSLDDRLSRAYLWIKAYEQTDWMQCMNCEQLIECITPLFEAQTSQILNEIRYGDGLTVPPGTKPPDSQNSANQAGATNPECNKDILWAQCQQMVQWLAQKASGAFAIAETASNDTELVGALMELPIIQEVGIAAVADYINLLLEGASENFDAQNTPEYRDTYACFLMQECCNDCIINVDRMYAAAEKRMRTHFSDFPTSFATIFDLWSYMSDQDIDGTIVFDFAMMLGIGGGSLANAFFADVGTRALETVLLLAVNDANDDWLILCPDCPEEWESTMPLDTDQFVFELLSGYDYGTGGEWVDTEGFIGTHSGASGNAYKFVQVSGEFDETELTYAAIRFDLENGTQTEPGLYLALSTNNGSLVEITTPPADGDNQLLEWTGIDTGATSFGVRVQSGWIPASVTDPGGESRLFTVILRGNGTKPSQLP